MSQPVSPDPVSRIRKRLKRVNWHQFLGKDFDLVFTPLGLSILLEMFVHEKSGKQKEAR